MSQEYRKIIFDATDEVVTQKVTKQFSDLDFDFIPHPSSGDIIPLKDADAIKRSIRNLMLTGKYERLFSPSLGANLKQLLFEPLNPMTEMSLRLLITDIVRLHEPRVKIIDIDVSITSDDLGYNASLTFSIDNISEITKVDFFLERLR